MVNGVRVPNDVIEDRYRLIRPIGVGGMAEVWHAHDEHLDRDVAVKLLPRAPHAVRDFHTAENEARLSAKLVHPNIVRVYDLGSENGLDFVVMELVSGAPLNQIRGGRSPSDSVELAAQIADALDHAHRTGVVHCDVKPQNVIVTDDGVAKLLDFGIAQRPTTVQGTSDGEFIGSLPYVAPEQARGEPIDARTDIYALGAVLYELLTGSRPFKATTAEESLRQRMTAPPASPRTLAPEIPASLEAVVLKALAPSPGDRYQTAGELRDALRASLSNLAMTEAVTQPYAVAAGAETNIVGSPVVQPADRSRTHKPVFALALAGLLLAVLASLISARSAAAPTSTAPAEASADPPTTATEPSPTQTSPIVAAPTQPPAPPAEEPPTVHVSDPGPLAEEPPMVRVSDPGPPPQAKPAPLHRDDKDERKDAKEEKKSGNRGRN
jgi:eukaryotic-like serine/threonine-protein kinase